MGKVSKLSRNLVCFSLFGSMKLEVTLKHGAKGQLISKDFLVSSILPKNEQKKFDFTTMIPQVNLFSFVFWRKLKTPIRLFEIN